MPLQSAARHSFGSTLWSAPWTPADPDTFTILGEHTEDSVVYGSLRSFGLSGRGFSEIKVSHLDSLNMVNEYIPGLEEGGQVDLDFWYSPVVLTALNALLPSVTRAFPDYGSKRWQLMDFEGSYLSLFGFLHPPEVLYEEDQPISIKTRIKVSKGRPTLTVV